MSSISHEGSSLGGTVGEIPNGTQAGSGGFGSTASRGRLPSGRGAAGAAARSASNPDALDTVTATSGAIPPAGPGWDRSAVYIGLTTQKDGDAVLSSSGSKLSTGDQEADARAIAAALNREGGLFGRKIVMYFKDTPVAQGAQDPNGSAQANCIAFTQDRRVLSAMTVGALDSDNYRQCMARNQVFNFSMAPLVWDDQLARTYSPYYYNTQYVGLDQLLPVLIPRLRAQGYFTGWDALNGRPNPAAKVKVGILYGTDPTSERQAPRFIAMLKRAGYESEGFQSGLASSSDASAAVLRFAADGVTHVMSVGGTLLTFAIAAKSQQYTPRLGLTSYDNLLLWDGTVPPSQLAGAKGVGWFPGADVAQAEDPGRLGGQAWCFAALRAGGQNPQSRLAQALGLAICDGIRLTVSAAQAGGGLDPASIRRGILRIGTSFPAAGAGFGLAGLTSTRYGIPGGGRDLSFEAGCGCFRYSGRTYRF